MHEIKSARKLVRIRYLLYEHEIKTYHKHLLRKAKTLAMLIEEEMSIVCIRNLDVCDQRRHWWFAYYEKKSNQAKQTSIETWKTRE